MKQIIRKAYAKINLGLDVVRRRPDGYHEVKMIMQTISLHDELRFEETGGKEIILVSNDNPLLPEDAKENLIYKAAECIRREYGIDRGVKITLQKNIPIAAGMAGGSTDAAAVFRHILIHILVAHGGLGVVDALLIKSLVEAKVGHNCGDNSII